MENKEDIFEKYLKLNKQFIESKTIEELNDFMKEFDNYKVEIDD